eukprot:GHVR01148616.1.p1 GENE.GHVR01148616.1~~GHVR01148616.1.p1  ORF type:complete len:214 (+),score=54.01 GHVR01148616.1:206-847(+)
MSQHDDTSYQHNTSYNNNTVIYQQQEQYSNNNNNYNNNYGILNNEYDCPNDVINLDNGKTVVYSIRLSRVYLAFCLINSLLAAVLLGSSLYWMFGRGFISLDTPNVLWFVVLEVMLTSFLCLETAAVMTLLGAEFWKSWWNIMDMCVALVSGVNLLVELLDVMGTLSGIPSDIVIVLMVVRYASQTARCVCVWVCVCVCLEIVCSHVSCSQCV